MAFGTYLFEVLRALAYLNLNAYKDVEDTIWRKLGSFAGQDEEMNLQCAAALVSVFSELDSDETIAKYYPQFLKVYQSYRK